MLRKRLYITTDDTTVVTPNASSAGTPVAKGSQVRRANAADKVTNPGKNNINNKNGSNSQRTATKRSSDPCASHTSNSKRPARGLTMAQIVRMTEHWRCISTVNESEIPESLLPSLEELIEHLLDVDMSAGNSPPGFEGIRWVDGGFLVTCANAGSTNWLVSHLLDFCALFNTPVTVGLPTPNMLPKPKHILNIFLDPSRPVPDNLLQRLAWQNTGLSTASWTEVERTPLEKSIRITLMVDGASKDFVNLKKNKLFLGTKSIRATQPASKKPDKRPNAKNSGSGEPGPNSAIEGKEEEMELEIAAQETPLSSIPHSLVPSTNFSLSSSTQPMSMAFMNVQNASGGVTFGSFPAGLAHPRGAETNPPTSLWSKPVVKFANTSNGNPKNSVNPSGNTADSSAASQTDLMESSTPTGAGNTTQTVERTKHVTPK